MLSKILENLKNDPNKECYQIQNKIYRNKELYRYVCNIYHYLLKNNAEKKNVIVYGEKEIYRLASFLACSCAGMTYIPIDQSTPEERKKMICGQIEPSFTIDYTIETIMQQENHQEITKIYLKDEDIYYIIFTSGSTGKPKGVKITYRNLKSCMNWLLKICNVKEAVILNQANFSFDLSVADMYLSLLTKSKHYILEKEVQKDYPFLFQELENSHANLAVMTPSFADLLLLDSSFDQNRMPYLKKILFCGERLTENTLTRLHERFTDLEIINSYGPTECTFAVTSTIVKKKEEISIGIPKEDVKIYLVNENLEKLPDNKIGEILITGASVGAGYVDENLNQCAFFKYENENAYLTGDLAYRKNGKIYYVGRKDRQIKYKGYRIEISEIEQAFNRLEELEKTVVSVMKNKEEKISRMIAFVKLKTKKELQASDIRKKIAKFLPEYMIPVIKIIDEIPLNENSKVDEKKLLEEYKNGN